MIGAAVRLGFLCASTKLSLRHRPDPRTHLLTESIVGVICSEMARPWDAGWQPH